MKNRKMGNNFDSLLIHYYDDYLSNKDSLAKNFEIPISEIFNDLTDIDLWVLLLSKRYTLYPNIRRRLPGFPSVEIQKQYNGQQGFDLIKRARVSYENIISTFKKYNSTQIRDINLLDFGVGWGRLIRFFLKDISSDSLFGCDVSDFIIAESKRLKLPITLKKSDPIPNKLPFDNNKFDLVISNSVFSHLSEEALNSCFNSIHKSMRKDGLFCFTTWAPNYAINNPKMSSEKLTLNQLNNNEIFSFVPQKPGLSFGATFISKKYMVNNWNNEDWTLKEIQLQNFGINQVMVVLQKK